MEDTSSRTTVVAVEPVNRDPNYLSTDLQFEWEHLVGEPKEFRSPDWVWKCSFWCFDKSKNWCYICLVVFCAPITAFFIGCSFASLAFQHIWCWTPVMRHCKITCGFARTIVRIIFTVLCVPMFESCGYVFSQIKIRMQRLPDGPDEVEELIYKV